MNHALHSGGSWKGDLPVADAEFGKISKSEKNTAVIFKVTRTNQVLQSNNENKTNRKQVIISPVLSLS